jgi:AcrR family transcriptional regulator/DNA-binding MarR family transcriptional regulator
MLAAMAEVSAERGAANVTVAHVVARSGVSRRTFYELFSDREECFLAAFDEAVARVSERVLQAHEPRMRWRERIRAALTAVLELLDDEPCMGRLVVVESLGAGPRAMERRTRVLAQIITVVDGGRLEAKKGAGPPLLTAEGVVGGVLSVLHSRLVQRERGSLLGLTGPLMSMIVLPYLGPAAARKEVERPVPECTTVRRAAGRDPLRDLEMRLTYRTVRVLIAIAAQPEGSNHAIARAAGIDDQGQASKLLSRLHQLGLIANVGAGPARGAPNAWALTEKGQEIHGVIAEQTARA